MNCIDGNCAKPSWYQAESFLQAFEGDVLFAGGKFVDAKPKRPNPS